MKRIGILVVIGLLSTLVGCYRPHSVDISSSPGFKDFIGTKYKTKMDLLVFKFRGSTEEMQITEPGTTAMPQFADLPKKFPYDYSGVKIYGVLPLGSVFRIAQIMQNMSPESGYQYNRVVIMSSGPFEGQTVATDTLTDVRDPTKYDPKYAERIPDHDQN